MPIIIANYQQSDKPHPKVYSWDYDNMNLKMALLTAKRSKERNRNGGDACVSLHPQHLHFTIKSKNITLHT